MADHVDRVLTRIMQDADPVWTLDRVQTFLGSEVSADTCSRALRRLERMRILVPGEAGTWIRASWSGRTQRDWYS